MVNKLADAHECPLDVKLYKFIDKHLYLYHLGGFTPNMVTTLSIFFGLFSAQQIGKGHFTLAAALLLIAYYLDCVDGKLAREYNMVTKFGDVYDHVGDLLKIIAIVAALFLGNTTKPTTKQWIYIQILLLLAIIQCVHLGYQEIIYNKQDESCVLKMWSSLVKCDKNPTKTIHYTKYFGCGTWYLCFAVLIIIWRK